MSVISDFKKFALRGNLLDMAIGFTVGAAFTTIAKSVVDDIIMPPVGLLLGRVDFKDMFVVLREGTEAAAPYVTVEAAQAAGAVTLNYGRFINNLISFMIVAFTMFLIIHFINRLDDQMEARIGEPPKPPEEPENKKCPFCRMAIPYRASRCPNCTSELPAEGEATA